MPFTSITKPNVGDPTKKQSFADPVIDNLNFLYNLLTSTIGSREIITNGSFESDVDADTLPDNWTRTLYTGGSFSHELSTSAADGKSIHGKRSVKFTSPGGGGNGGGFIETTDFFEVSSERYYFVSFSHKASVAGIHNLVEISWYDSTQTLISTNTVYDSTTNPTAWTAAVTPVKAATNARFAKVKLTGAKNDNTTAGSAWFDDIRINSAAFETTVIIDNADPDDDGAWLCPAQVRVIELTVIGGGGGGGGQGSADTGTSGGGGAGGLCKAIVSVTPGTYYYFTVGDGGVGGSLAANGSAGQASNMVIGATTYLANGGAGGIRSGTGDGAGGAGGTASGGQLNLTGGNGQDGNNGVGTGGNGGTISLYGVAGKGGVDGGTESGADGLHWGAGGGGAEASGTGDSGGDGHDGAIIIRF